MLFLSTIILALGMTAPNSMEISSPAFKNNQPIPAKYTCQGEDISPELTIAEIPSNTKTLCLIVEDPEAPQGTVDHWVVWNITPNNIIISEGEKNVGIEGVNTLGKKGYHGPCPPAGSLHHYHFKLYALDIKLNLPEGSSKAQVLKAIQGHILEEAELIGTFQR